jgi:hypothetical protein
MLKIWKPEDVLDFGKNSGFTLEEVYQFQPNYIVWLIFNKENFAIDLQRFNLLPIPTPFSVGAVNGSEEMRKIKGVKEMLRKADNSNMHVNVSDIKDFFANEKVPIAQQKFYFTNEVIEVNKRKCELFKNSNHRSV